MMPCILSDGRGIRLRPRYWLASERIAERSVVPGPGSGERRVQPAW